MKLNSVVKLAFTASLLVTTLAWTTDTLQFDRQKPFPLGVVGQNYIAIVRILGGTPPYQCVVKTGQLPPGLTMETKNRGKKYSYCLIHGMPTKSGTWDGLTIVEKADAR